MNAERSSGTSITCTDVVSAYGAVLESIKWQDRPIVPESELPYERALIKEALVTLAASENCPIPIETLKGGFTELASFQDSIPSADIPWSKIGGAPPSTREELATFFQQHDSALKAQQIAMEFVIRENARLAEEWETRLASQRMGK